MAGYGTQSLRRAKVTQIYKKTGNLRAVQPLLGHTKMGVTFGIWALILKMRWQ
jgi:site-specific recombinase XerC